MWRKWDLHIHSPLSILNNKFPKKAGEPDWEAYISRLEATGLAVVGITDYFTIEGYKRVREFKAKGRLQNISTILPNVELRLNKVLSTRKDGENPRRLNFHVLFSDELTPQAIEEHFLHNLDFYYEANPQSPDEARKLKPSNIESLGKKLIEENRELRDAGAQPLLVGARTTVVDDKQVAEILSGDSRFKDKYVLVLPEELSSLIKWGGQDHVTRKVLLQKSDMVFSSNPHTVTWCLGLPPYDEGPASFVKEFKSLKPCIHGSDAHDLDTIARPCAKRGEAGHTCDEHAKACELRFCWIKADPTFEGLKQLKYEPSDRVRIQDSDPTPLKSNSCIKALRIEAATVNDELSLATTNLPLNDSLVAVTGGKGAGKTAFVDILSNHFKDRCNTSDRNSFVRRIVQDKAEFDTAITLGDGALFEKAIKSSRFVEQSEIVYIAQGELEEYIGENSDLDQYIRDLIFETPEIKNSVKVFEFEKLSKRRVEIEIEITHRNDRIQRLEEQTAEKVTSATRREKAQVEAELRDVESKIPILQAQLTSDKINVVEHKQGVLSKLVERRSRLSELGELLANARQFVSEDINRFNSQTTQINMLLRELGFQSSLPSLDYEGVSNLETVATEADSQLKETVSQIEASQKELQGYEAGMQEHARHLSRRAELSRRLSAVNKRIENFALEVQQLQDSRLERNTLFEQLLQNALNQQAKYGEIIEVFGSQKAKVLSDLEFKAHIQFAQKKLLGGLEEVLDNRQVEVFGTNEVESQFQLLQDGYKDLTEGVTTAARGLVDETSRLSEGMKGKVKKAQTISVLNLYKVLYGTYLTVIPVVTYKKTALNKLSLGQKATVLIKIYLAQGTNPIVIDSHDDHLDNEFIMDELIAAIREAKTYRQVILASNNGNVVINSDAEQIVIADRQQGKISYTSGSIENPTIRDRALKVLEGGADAFKRRQEKYRIT